MSTTIELLGPDTEAPAELADDFAAAPYLRRKRLGVRVLALLIAAPLAPVLLLLIVLIRVTSPGPGLYRQRRVGLRGREFTLYKLRSMRQDAEDLSGPVWASINDERVTLLGRLLRFTHLDELPQIINVIKGEMAFVGPRPERPEIVVDLIRDVDHYEDRHLALPGVTGLAQVNLRPDVTVECVRNKVSADRYYIEHANLWLDLRIILATMLRLVGVRYRYGTHMLGLSSERLGFRLYSHTIDHARVDPPAPMPRDPALVDTQAELRVDETLVDCDQRALAARRTAAPSRPR